ncbi:MAG TPA: glutamate-cysteine ligase family protein [Planctomycetaceae bacterium]|nr:glutamate-cysteine ligase family protein [Planctomycetaceae bacterium]
MESDDPLSEDKPAASASLFSRFGVELEYMIVDARSLDVRPIADELLAAAAGEITGEVERGDVTWSNELVAHVVEFKVTEPARALADLPGVFQREVREANALLAPLGARLMPGGMHPWMNPLCDTKLWSHEFNEVYEAFDRIFGCQGHGWSNLQSVHLNLPFADDDEFGRLHAAIRLVLPILPGLTASSPVIDGRLSGVLDNRLEVYRTNSRKVPMVAGRVIPEPVFTRAAYETDILQQLYAAIAPHDPAGVLQYEWLNARGAIARFMRNTIEIRVMDVQECPEADVAICAAVVALLRALIAGRFAPLGRQQSVAIEPLEAIFLAAIRDADQSLITDADYLALFDGPVVPCTVGDLWRRLIETLLTDGLLDPRWQPTLEIILREGPLARRLTNALKSAHFAATTRESLQPLYAQLCDCLDAGRIFRA